MFPMAMAKAMAKEALEWHRAAQPGYTLMKYEQYKNEIGLYSHLDIP